MSGGIRSSSTTIPNNVRKTIQNIKEITGNHSDDDIYTMLKECSMDPNETAQKLLHQDTFHEVKRRKDRKKENQPSQDTKDSRWKLGPSGRGGRGNYTFRYEAHHDMKDAGIGRSTPHKENGNNQVFNKTTPVLSPSVSRETKSKDAGSSVSIIANGPIGVVSGGTKGDKIAAVPSENVVKQPEISSQRQSRIEAGKRSNMAFTGWESRDALGKASVKPHGAGKNQAAEVSQPSLPGGSSSSQPFSNYGSRLHHGTGSLKVGLNKEWKPKPISSEGQKSMAPSHSSNVSAEVGLHTLPSQNTSDSEEASKLHKDLESLHVRDTQHVIIPNHIHVPEALRTTLSFGSFDSSFVITSGSSSEPENLKNPEPPGSETHHGSETVIEQPDASQSSSAPAEDADYVDNSQPTTQVSHDVSSTDVGDDSNKEVANGLQHSSVETLSSPNFGLMPPVLSSPLGALESSETQASEISSLAVQTPVDPSSFYARVYRSGSDNDGRISPYPIPGNTAKYNGNIAFLSAQTSQSPREGGNSMVLHMDGQTPLTTQPPNMMPTTMAVTQQPMPIFRQPPGVHLPHYPPNYLPYGHYFSPFFVPPPAMHQFLANNTFPQQPQASGVYPGPPLAATAASAVTFPLSQYKPGSNTRNSAHVGIVGMYGPYGAPSSTGSATTAGNSNANEDIVASQFKESYMYRQQTEGPGVWIPTPAREISTLSGNSLYNIAAPQGQHVTFAPTQGAHATFPGIYHPAQAVTAAAVHPHPLLQQSQPMPGVVDMVGATAAVYQQPPQHAQMNWPNNF